MTISPSMTGIPPNSVAVTSPVSAMTSGLGAVHVENAPSDAIPSMSSCVAVTSESHMSWMAFHTR
jgi:hypothetical protein